ncbi:MAG: hypothetical protein Q9163_002017, partial [Psora crenata]
MKPAVLIEEPESISPDTSPTKNWEGRDISLASTSPKQYHTRTSKRLSGRSARKNASTPSLHSISSISSHRSATDVAQTDAAQTEAAQTEAQTAQAQTYPHVRRPERASHIISQVAEWLNQEKAKQAARKSATYISRARLAHVVEATKSAAHALNDDQSRQPTTEQRRSSSDMSAGALALEKLEQILSLGTKLDGKSPTVSMEGKRGPYFPRRRSTRKGPKHLFRRTSTGAMSDSDPKDDELLVPAAEVTLDNSKTLRYSGGAAGSEKGIFNSRRRAAKEREAWGQFKSEIVRLTHTLRISGWRRVPIDQGAEIDVERLSGALTNAVYVVSPPTNLSETPGTGQEIEHLIDRESELQILRRLSRKKIGPRLLGTFINGRFEQYFHARTLTAKDLRIPDTSKQIAKRMRELHDGIELLEEEREAGAFIWRNWDKWVERCEDVISWLDAQILGDTQGPARSNADGWKRRGLVCGVQWSTFRRAVDKYRGWLYKQYGGSAGIKQDLVFAHNDTQYGNLLRIEPSGESPLLLPANEHKQLVVIDFEYASANVPGLEFANHFTEWCYDYHDAFKPYALREKWYPTVEEQRRFLRAYVQHNPPIRPSATPRQSFSQGPTSSQGSTSSISTFVLDSRAPPAQYAENESSREKAVETKIERLRHEARIWRIANSAQWVAWGIVQAKVPGMNEAVDTRSNDTPRDQSLDSSDQGPHALLGSDPLSPEMAGLRTDALNKRSESEEAQDTEQEEEQFDYLGYAQERAMFFWGDLLQLGLVKREDLPQELLEK